MRRRAFWILVSAILVTLASCAEHRDSGGATASVRQMLVSITGRSPASGVVGTSVQLTGSGFTGTTAVTFNDTLGTGGGPGLAANPFTVVDDTHLNATVPFGAVTGPIQVQNGSTTSSAVFTVISGAAPTVTNLSTNSGGVGLAVTLTGTDFNGVTSVSFNGTASTSVIVASDSQLTAIVPTGATSGPIAVANTAGTGASGTFTIIPPPVVNSFSPATAAPGDTITITGLYFYNLYGVDFGGQAASVYTPSGSTQITATVPPGAMTGPITVFTQSGQGKSSASLTVIASQAPSITSFNPTADGVGNAVTLTGSGFTGTTSVKFNGVAATNFSLSGDTTLNTWVPVGATSGPITVTNGLGSAISGTSFTVLGPPTVSSFNPTSGGPFATVVITGAGFTGATDVKFSNGGPSGAAAPITVDNDGQITTSVPLGAISGPISVSGPTGTGTSGLLFTVTSAAAPTISLVSPNSGGQGTNVTITGTGFTGATTVTFHGVTSGNFTVLSDTQISASPPNGATTGAVAVTNSVGTAIGPVFTFQPPPTITSFTPSSGKAGDTVVITGTGFTGATSVTLANSQTGPGISMNPTVDSDTQITAVVPLGGSTAQIAVVTPGGYGRSGPSFTVLSTAAPTVTGFNPSSGSQNVSVVITGTGFTGATAVSFNGAPAAFTVTSDTQISAVVPAAATTGPVSVTNTKGVTPSATPFTIVQPPSISNIAPGSGAPGATIVITEVRLTGATTVSFSPGTLTGTGGPTPPRVTASFTPDSDTQITATVPSGAASGPIEVDTVLGTATSSTSFTVTSPQAPSINFFTPTLGASGTFVQVSGQGFTGTTAVQFNGTAAQFSLNGDTMLSTIVPTGAGTGPITIVNTAGQAVSVQPFTVYPPPSVTGFNPTSGPIGTVVTVTGTGFTDTSSVRLGFVDAVFTVVNDTTLHVTIPSGAGNAPIGVTTPYGSASTASPFNIQSSGPPNVSGFSPSSGGPGVQVTISGTNFSGATSVRFAGSNTYDFAVQNDTTITAYVPPGAKTGPIQVSNSSGSANSATNFVVSPPPTISGFSPSSGGVGTTVTITGSGFSSVALVRFGNAIATFTAVSDTSISATVPTGATSGPIEVGGGLSTQTFTVISSAAPTISAFSPTSGVVGDSTHVTGQNFTGVTQVSFNGVVATNVGVQGDTDMYVYVPAGATTGPISVTNSVGTAVSTGSFTVIPPPSITSISPTSGKVGDSVVITGTGLSNVATVTFGGGAQASFTPDSDTQITAVVPPSAASGSISLNNNVNIVSAQKFTVLPSNAPTITGFSPGSGAPGAAVKIDGTDLGSASSVDFAGVPATFQVNGVQITATVPLGATSGPIHVTNSIGTGTSSGSFTIVAPPVITTFSPSSGPAGTLVTVSGSGFTGTSTVFVGPLGGAQAVYSIVSDTELTVTVPVAASTGPITVETTIGSTTSAKSFVVTATAAPTITSFGPSSGGIGTMVRFNGSGFSGMGTVTFTGGSTALFRVSSDTAMDVIVPAGAQTGPVTIKNSAGSATTATDFTFDSTQNMTVTGVSPAAGPPGTVVSITGTNLLGATVAMPNLQGNINSISNTDTQIVVAIPASATLGYVLLQKKGTTNAIALFQITLYTPTCTVGTPGVGCGLCKVCDTGGSCAAAGVDDTGCGTIDCSGKNTSCVTYQDLTSARCASIGVCHTADSAACTSKVNAPNGTACSGGQCSAGKCAASGGGGADGSAPDGAATDSGSPGAGGSTSNGGAGAGGSAASGGGTSLGPDAGAPTASSKNDGGCGCRVATNNERPTDLLWVLAGMGVLGTSRRRRGRARARLKPRCAGWRLLTYSPGGLARPTDDRAIQRHAPAHRAGSVTHRNAGSA